MHALIKDGQVVKYPYGDSDLRRDNRNVGFPKVIKDEVFSKYGAERVFFSTQPEITYAQELKEGDPVFQDGRWNQTFTVVDLAEEEVAGRTAQRAEEVRADRDKRLAETDWRFRSDMNPSQEWVNYCQALRDVPAQEGFPWNVQWPTQPE
jgi:hypothetical protein